MGRQQASSKLVQEHPIPPVLTSLMIFLISGPLRFVFTTPTCRVKRRLFQKRSPYAGRQAGGLRQFVASQLGLNVTNLECLDVAYADEVQLVTPSRLSNLMGL
jgi:hypothetical protein